MNSNETTNETKETLAARETAEILAFLLSGKFRPLSENERDGFAGAGEHAFIAEDEESGFLFLLDLTVDPANGFDGFPRLERFDSEANWLGSWTLSAEYFRERRKPMTSFPALEISNVKFIEKEKPGSKTRVFVFPSKAVRESLIGNLRESVARGIFQTFAEDVLRTTELETASLSFSRLAGCRCGCSPGFVVDSSSKNFPFDLFIDLSAKGESR